MSNFIKLGTQRYNLNRIISYCRNQATIELHYGSAFKPDSLFVLGSGGLSASQSRFMYVIEYQSPEDAESVVNKIDQHLNTKY